MLVFTIIQNHSLSELNTHRAVCNSRKPSATFVVLPSRNELHRRNVRTWSRYETQAAQAPPRPLTVPSSSPLRNDELESGRLGHRLARRVVCGEVHSHPAGQQGR